MHELMFPLRSVSEGTGLSVYLTYGLVMAGVMSKEEGMLACLLSGTPQLLHVLVAVDADAA
jgi:hypothetical protein